MSEIIEFKAKEKASPKISVTERVLKCAEKSCEKCSHCSYRAESAKMVTDFLGMDMATRIKNTGMQMSYWDMKDILIQALELVKDVERKSGKEDK